MHLAFDLERRWCYQCIEQISKQDVPGWQKLIQRLHDTMTAARDNYDLLNKLDICTSVDLRRHMKCVGKDLSETRKYIEGLDHDISAATDTEKLEDQPVYHFQSAVRDFKAQIKEAQAEIQRQIAKKAWDDKQRPKRWDKKGLDAENQTKTPDKKGLDDLIQNAQHRSDKQKKTVQWQQGKEKERG